MDNKIVKDVVNEILTISKDKDIYISTIRNNFLLDGMFFEIIEKYKFTYKLNENQDNPKVTLQVFLDDYKIDKVQVKYYCYIEFTKLHRSIVHIFFRYSIVNPDPDRISINFTDDVYDPLTVKQSQFYAEIKALLQRLNIYRLNYSEINYVLCHLSFTNDSMKFFGAQPTLEMFAFNDFFSILP